MPTLLTHFVQARAQGTYDRLLKRLAKLSLLVIDDFGLAALSDLEKQDLLEAIEERYGCGATILTSHLPISDWHEYLAADASPMPSSTGSCTLLIASNCLPESRCVKSALP